MDTSILIGASLFSTAWVLVLTQENAPFYFIPNFIAKRTDNEIIHKLTYECECCIAGQIALWWSVFTLSPYIIINICGAIILAGLISKLWEL